MAFITDDLATIARQFGDSVSLPRFDVEAARAEALRAPRWLHIGPGNLYRALHAKIAQQLLDDGTLASGVVVAGTAWPAEIEQIYTPNQDRNLAVVMAPDGSLETTLLASTGRAIYAGQKAPGLNDLMAVAADPGLQLVTVSITEKGYATRDATGAWLPMVADDIASGPATPTSAMGIVTYLLHARWTAGAAPIAMVSTDNFSANGDRFAAAVKDVATAWAEGGLVDQAFVGYVTTPALVSFPCTMIDRITPNPSPEVAARLTDAGWQGMDLVQVSASTVMAAFANTEPTWYLVVEDAFPNGRPPLEDAGVLMADKETVNLADEMKVTACLNPLHTALAVFGVTLGFDRIWQEMQDPDLTALVRRLGYDEMLPVAPEPGVISARSFLDEVVNNRLPNQSLPDAPGRIAADTSAKLPIRFGTALRRYMDEGIALDGLRAIPLVLAGWLRYLMGVDDNGTPMTLSPDPRLDELTSKLARLTLGGNNREIAEAVGIPLLGQVLGVDIASTPLAGRVADDLCAMTSAPGAVRQLLHSGDWSQ